MQLWRTWNSQKISLCPNRNIPTVQLMQEEDNGDDSTHLVINKYNELQNGE